MDLKQFLKKKMGLYPNVNKTIELGSKRFGNNYGGFSVHTLYLNKNSIIYSVGIGKDISFDLEIMNYFGCKIYAYDPTPGVKEWLNLQNTSSKFIFSSVGLYINDGLLTFYKPLNPNYISHSFNMIDNTQIPVEVPCNKLSTLMKMNNHEYIDLLKMDIEGFEYNVLNDILEEKILVKQIVVEFHHNFKGVGNSATENTVKILINNDYHLFSISDNYQEYSFIKKSFINT